MVSSAGTCAQAAAVIGEACAVRKVMTMALIIAASNARTRSCRRTLATLRPMPRCSSFANGEEYIEEMLAALRRKDVGGPPYCREIPAASTLIRGRDHVRHEGRD